MQFGIQIQVPPCTLLNQLRHSGEGSEELLVREKIEIWWKTQILAARADRDLAVACKPVLRGDKLGGKGRKRRT